MPKGFESTGETHRKITAPTYFSFPTSASPAAKKEVVIVKGKGEKLSAIPYSLFHLLLLPGELSLPSF